MVARYPLNSQRLLGTQSRLSAFSFRHLCTGTTTVDRKNRIGRRDLGEILKSAQGRGEGVVAVDKCQLEPLRPNTILRMLEERIARRYRERHIWPSFPWQHWVKPG
jgi:hypothetical protein